MHLAVAQNARATGASLPADATSGSSIRLPARAQPVEGAKCTKVAFGAHSCNEHRVAT
jgi:hypothetical protein